MLKLLKANLYRIVKAKLFYITLAIVFALPLLMVLLYYAIGVASVALTSDETFKDLIGVNYLIGSAFSPTDNMGLVLIVFGSIFIANDFSHGTLRNKIIIGNTRTNVVLSHFVSTLIYLVVMIVFYALFLFFFGTLFLGYDKIDAEKLNYLFQWLVLGILTYVYIASLVTLGMMVTKNVALTIIFSFVLSFALQLIATAIIMIAPETLQNYLHLLPLYSENVIQQTHVAHSTIHFIEGVGSLVLFSAVNVVVAVLLFKKTDLK